MSREILGEMNAINRIAAIVLINSLTPYERWQFEKGFEIIFLEEPIQEEYFDLTHF